MDYLEHITHALNKIEAASSKQISHYECTHCGDTYDEPIGCQCEGGTRYYSFTHPFYPMQPVYKGDK